MEIKKIRKRKEKQRNRFKTLAIVLFERLGTATLGHIEETKGNVGRERDKEPRRKQNGESNDGTPPQTDGKKKEKRKTQKKE
jgi:hypothetical protein